MDIDYILFMIIKKYDIYKAVPELYDFYKENLYINYVDEFIRNLSDNCVLAIRGGGIHTYELLNRLDVQCRKKIKYVIDKNIRINISGCQVVHPDQIADYNIDTVIISSYKCAREFKAELLDYMGKMDIVDPYEHLANEEMYYDREFYAYADKEIYHTTYIDTTTTYHLFLTQKKIELKRFYLEKLIAQCIEIKDFILAQKMIELYIESGWDTNNRYNDFWQELDALFDDITCELEKRAQKDIIINWIDSVNAEDFYQTEFANERKKDSCVFYNAYTVIPWTRFTLITLLTGMRPITDHIYVIEDINTENSPVLKELVEHGYQFLYLANAGLHQEMFEKNRVLSVPCGFNKLVLNNRGISDCSTRLQWNSIKERLISERPICHLIHNLAESHAPFGYTTVESLNGERNNYRLQGMNFIAEQLNWYERFHVGSETCIYLSDHGDATMCRRPYEKGRTNIVFMIKGPGIPVKEEMRLYSHENFSRVISAIIDSTKWDYVFTESVIYENLDYFYADGLMRWIFDWISRRREHNMNLYQCRGIRTSEELYVKYAIGKELYFRLPDEDTNRIDDVMWQDRIEYLRNKCGNEFIDINRNKFFEESYRLYDYLKMLPEVNW